MARLATRYETEGVSPKLIFGVLAAVVSFLVTQELVDFAAGVDLLINAAAVAIAAFLASPGDVVPVNE